MIKKRTISREEADKRAEEFGLNAHELPNDAKPAIQPEVSQQKSATELEWDEIESLEDDKFSKKRGTKEGGCSTQVKFNKYENKLLEFVKKRSGGSKHQKIIDSMVAQLEIEAEEILEKERKKNEKRKAVLK